MQVFIFLILLTLLVFLFDINVIKAFKGGLNFFSDILKSFSESLFKQKTLFCAIEKSFLKLNPLYTLKNPLVFIVELGAIIITAITCSQALKLVDFSFNFQLAAWLWITVYCSNLIESLAESKEPQPKEPLSKSKTYVNRISKNGKVESVPVIRLKKGDLILLRKNETVPCDGVLFSGIALIDESSICGSTIPVAKEADTEKNKIYQGTKVLYGNIKLKITKSQALTIFDQFLNIHNLIKKNKTPDEAAVDSILIGLAIIFLGIIFLLVIFADYSKVIIATSSLIALFVCLLPTTIGGLLPAIGPSSVKELAKQGLLSETKALDKHLDNTYQSPQNPNTDNFFQSYKLSNDYAREQSAGFYQIGAKLEQENNLLTPKSHKMSFTSDMIKAEAIAISDFSNKIDFEYMLAAALNVLGLAKQILIARGNLVIFSLAYDISKYFAIIPALCLSGHPVSGVFNLLQMASIKSAVLSVVMFNALIIFLLIPFAFPDSIDIPSEKLFRKNIKTYIFLGILLPFICVKIINVLVVYFHLA